MPFGYLTGMFCVMEKLCRGKEIKSHPHDDTKGVVLFVARNRILYEGVLPRVARPSSSCHHGFAIQNRQLRNTKPSASQYKTVNFAIQNRQLRHVFFFFFIELKPLKKLSTVTTHRSPSAGNQDPKQTSCDRPRVAHLATVSDV